MDTQNLLQEFDRQVTNLLSKGYAKIAKLTEQQFLDKVKPLRSIVDSLSTQELELDLGKGRLPFVIVTNQLLSSEEMMQLVNQNSNKGVTILRPHTAENFRPISNVSIPDTTFYLLIDIDRGHNTLNIPPNEAIKSINQSDRSPLTIDEGIAIVTHFPEFLIKNNCFSLLASRTGKDQRVPAIWINGKKEPNLGWCWDGNPHTWLGSASGKQRIS